MIRFDCPCRLLLLATVLIVVPALVGDNAAGREKEPAQPASKKPAAVDEKKPVAPSNKKFAVKSAVGKPFQLPERVEQSLTAEQRAQMAELHQEYNRQSETSAGKIGAILTPERLQAQAEAASQAAASKLDELLSAQEKADLQAARESLDSVQGELRDKIMALLTDEQRAELKSKGRGEKAEAAPPKKKPVANEKPVAK